LALAGGFSLLQESVTVLEWNLLYQLIASELPVYRSSIGLFLDYLSNLLHPLNSGYHSDYHNTFYFLFFLKK